MTEVLLLETNRKGKSGKVMEGKSMEQREMYTEITALVGSIAKALVLPEPEVIKAIEENKLVINFGQDDDGERYIGLDYEGKKARLYKGAIYYEDVDAAH